MSGPERLEVDRPPLRRRTGWLLGGVALAVVGGLAVVRVGADPPAPAPSPTASSSARLLPPSAPRTVDRGWPTGLGLDPGTLFVLADDGLHTVDVSGGLVEDVTLDVAPTSTELTPLSAGVLVWPSEGGRARYLAYAGDGGLRPEGPLRSVHAVLPGPDGSVWVGPADGRDPTRTTTWVQADEAGARGPRARVRGAALADGAGGLFGVERTRLRHAWPGAQRDLGAGHVLAVGPDGWLSDRCVRGTCTTTLHDGSTGEDAPVEPPGTANPLRAAVLLEPGALSAGNRFVAESVDTENGELVRVSRVGLAPEVLRTFPGGSGATAFAWLSPRWLVATSGDRLVLYDAEGDTLLAPELGFTGASRLVFRAT